MPTIKKNFLYQTIYQLLIILTPLITAPYVSRVLGAQNIGIYSYAASIAFYFAIFARLGLTHHGARIIAAVRDDRDKLNKTFSDLLLLHVVVSLIALAAYVGFFVFFAGELKIYFIIQGFTVLSALFDINWLFMGLEQVKLTATRSVFIKIIAVVCVFVFVKDAADLWKYTLILTFATFAGQAVVWLFIKRFVSLVRPTWHGIKAHLRPIFVLFIPVVAGSVYTIFNKVMLGTMTDKTQLGFYTNSEKIILVPLGLIIAFNAVMLPRMSNITAKGNEAEKNRLTRISMKYVMLLAFAMTFGIAGVADNFAPRFFGWEFKDCGALITAFCLMIPFLSFQGVISSQYLIPNSKDRILTVSAVAGAIVNITANLLLIPHFHAMGAVIGTVLAESLRCIIVVIAVRKSLPIGTYIRNSAFFLLTGAAMFLLVRFVGGAAGDSIAAILLQIASGGVFYVGISAFYLHVSKDPFFVNNVVKRLKK
jgi:O-antigen/teichoic acid export membrane protein